MLQNVVTRLQMSETVFKNQLSVDETAFFLLSHGLVRLAMNGYNDSDVSSTENKSLHDQGHAGFNLYPTDMPRKSSRERRTGR